MYKAARPSKVNLRMSTAQPEAFAVDDVSIKFPYEPYEVQKVYMQKVVECLKDQKFGCLESPTGTGKTLALLCASLAWLQSQRSSLRDATQANNASGGGADADIKALLDGGLPVEGGGAWGGGDSSVGNLG